MHLLTFLALTAYFTLEMVHMKEENFGKFTLNLDKFEKCRGPKRNDCGNITVQIINQTAVDYYMHLPRSVVLTKGKVIAKTNGSVFFRLQMKNPCDHLFMKQIMRTTLNASSNCVIESGLYKMVFDINRIAQTYYGGAFLFGHFAFRSLFMAEDCNLSCSDVEVTFVPKNT